MKSRTHQFTMNNSMMEPRDADHLFILARRGNQYVTTIAGIDTAARKTMLLKSPSTPLITTITDYRTHLKKQMKRPLDCSPASERSSSKLHKARGRDTASTFSSMKTMRNHQQPYTSYSLTIRQERTWRVRTNWFQTQTWSKWLDVAEAMMIRRKKGLRQQSSFCQLRTLIIRQAKSRVSSILQMTRGLWRFMTHKRSVGRTLVVTSRQLSHQNRLRNQGLKSTLAFFFSNLHQGMILKLANSPTKVHPHPQSRIS